MILNSDWMVASVGRNFGNVITTIVKRTLKNGKCRWSRTIGQFNLIDLSLRDRDRVARIMTTLKVNSKWGRKLKQKWDGMRESRSVPLPDSLHLEEMMFKEAKRRAQNVHIYNVLIQARTYRGIRTLERHGQLKKLEWSMNKEFDECIILWHIGTDICYHKDRKDNNSNQMTNHVRDVSWKVSNYMIYLLITQPSMLQVGYGKKRFDDTCTEVKKILHRRKREKEKEARDLLQSKEKEAHDHDLVLDEKPADSSGINSDKGNEKVFASVLHDGCRLARKLQESGKKINWLLISEVWMEMLGYAAIHCESYQHAKALSRGGELLTHLWLLMAQLGVVEEHKMQQFQSASV